MCPAHARVGGTSPLIWAKFRHISYQLESARASGCGRVNWPARAILVGECKWGTDAVDRQTVRDLIERTIPLTVADLPDKGAGWQVIPALFARAGATPAARKTLTEAGGMVVDLPTLFADLAEA